MVRKERSFVEKIFLKEWHVLHGLHMPILIISQDEEDIRLLRNRRCGSGSSA